VLAVKEKGIFARENLWTRRIPDSVADRVTDDGRRTERSVESQKIEISFSSKNPGRN
jgi:hypothetical protein